MDLIKLTDTGLQIATRSEIYNELCGFAKVAYGDDISLDEGTPFEVFIGLLADSISNVNGATQSVSELFSTKTLSGNFLDFVAGQRGIVRKSKRNQRVTVTVTVDQTIPRPYIASANTIYLKDWKDRIWVNTSQLLIQPKKFSPISIQSQEDNFQGTCEFTLMPLNGYDTDLLHANNNGQLYATPSKPLIIADQSDLGGFDSSLFEVNNFEDAEPAIAETETDPQLRARYDNAVYSSATATIESLRANLLKHSNYVRIIQNLTNSSEQNASTNPYGIEAHSIWVIVDGGSTTDNSSSIVSTDANDITVAQTILNYKSLGCGVSVPSITAREIVVDGETLHTGNFLVEFPIDTMTAQIPFTRLIENAVSFAVVLSATTLDSAVRDSVVQKVIEALQQYVAILEPGDVITQVDMMNAIYTVLSQYPVGQFDVSSVTVNYNIGSKIEIYQRAVFDSATVTYGA